MSQKKLVGALLFILGGVLLYFGFNQANSALGEISETLTGKYSDETMIYLIAGAASMVVGLRLLTRK